MYRFISERYYEGHKEYLRTLRLRYSIYEKEMRSTKGVSFEALSHIDLPKDERVRAQALLTEILLHEAYFNSFCNKEYAPSTRVRELFSSEANLINQIYGMAMSACGGFVGVWERGHKPQFFAVSDYTGGLSGKPIFALDISEHAYFGDYGFCKERYVTEALKYIKTEVFDSIF